MNTFSVKPLVTILHIYSRIVQLSPKVQSTKCAVDSIKIQKLI